MNAAGPLYLQATEALRSRIRQKTWRPGDRLPPESHLCQELGVSSITMRRAMASLVAEGLLQRMQGKGTFVTSDQAIVQGPSRLTSFTEDGRARGWRCSARVLAIGIEPAPPEASAKLGLADGAETIVLNRLRLADGLPVAIHRAYIPPLLFPGIEARDFSQASLYEVFQSEYGVRPASAIETYHAVQLAEPDARLLDCSPGSPAFHIERLTSDGTGQRIEVVDSLIRADRYALVLNLTASRHR